MKYDIDGNCVLIFIEISNNFLHTLPGKVDTFECQEFWESTTFKAAWQAGGKQWKAGG